MRPTSKVSRRDFLRLSAVTVAGAAAVACVPAAPATEMTDDGEAAPSAEMVELVYWYDNSYPEASMNQAGEEFNETQANTSIEMVPLPYGEAIQKVYVALAGGEAPFDLTFNHPMQRATYAVRGVLIPLNDYIEADDRVNLDNFYPGLVENLSWQGQVYAIADGAHPMFVLYNPTLIEEAGLEDPWDVYQAGGWTLEKWEREYAGALTVGEGVERQWGRTPTPRTIRIENLWIWGFGGDVWNEDVTETVINEAEAIEAWNWMADTTKMGYTPTPAQAEEFRGGAEMMNTERVAMGFFHREILPYLREDLVLGQVPLPAMPNGPTITRNPPEGPGIYSGSEHPDEAWEYVSFNTTRTHELLILAHYGDPTSPQVAESDLWLKEGLLAWERPEVVDIAAAQVTRVILHIPGIREMDALIQGAWDEIVLDRKTAQAAMDEVKPEIDELIAEYREEYGDF
jgi:multiple sugar transport system substrate-binding protein